MSTSTTSQAKKGARWTPFQCPACFALFRIRRDNLGKKGRCPQCEALLLVPNSEKVDSKDPSSQTQGAAGPDTAKTIAVVQSKSQEESKVWQEDRSANRRKRFMGGSENDLDWEEEGEERRKSFSWLVVGSCAMMVCLLVGVGIYQVKNMASAEGSSKSVVIGDAESLASVESDLKLQKNQAYLNEQGEDMAEKSVDEYNKFDLVQIETVVRAFLEADTVAKKIAVVRESDRVAPLMKKYYGGEGIEPEGLDEMNRAEISYRDDVLTTFVRIADFSSAPIAIQRIKVNDEVTYKVDWESWVGYCEMTAGEINSNWPQDPVLLRVLAGKKDYYNYEYSDDKVWSSYRLEFRNGEDSLLGYAKKGTEAEEKLAEMISDDRTIPCTIRVKSPKRKRGSDQVEILELVNQGWIMKFDKDSKELKDE